MAKYQTNLEINSLDGSECIEIRNPSSSGKNLEIVKIGVVSETGFAVYDLQRYDELATHESSPAPSQAQVFQWNPLHDASVGEVWFGESTSITFGGAMDFHHDEQLDSSDGGDDAEIIFGKYLDGEQITMLEGTSARFELPQNNQANYVIKIIWQEVAAGV